mmetsp:Transcript_58674/g.164630  ORF Transcript_58674/g.164630 Transcript_58674/m.164630 type:complete len:304 (-) Transcript_58674:238-1149(-)
MYQVVVRYGEHMYSLSVPDEARGRQLRRQVADALNVEDELLIELYVGDVAIAADEQLSMVSGFHTGVTVTAHIQDAASFCAHPGCEKECEEERWCAEHFNSMEAPPVAEAWKTFSIMQRDGRFNVKWCKDDDFRAWQPLGKRDLAEAWCRTSGRAVDSADATLIDGLRGMFDGSGSMLRLPEGKMDEVRVRAQGIENAKQLLKHFERKLKNTVAPRRSSDSSSGSSSTGTSGGSFDEVAALKAKNVELRKQCEKYTCTSCGQKDRECLFQPCRHFVSCKSCADQRSDCPACKESVDDKQLVLM